MHLEQLTPAHRRIAALAILMVLIAAVTGSVALPYSAVVASYDGQVERHNKKLALQRAIVRDGEKARGQQRTLERIESANGFFLVSNEPALASAELQRRVKLVIEQSGATIVSSQMLGEKNQKQVEQVLLRVQMRCGVEELQKVLHTLEAQSPVLLLDNILIGARPAGGVIQGKGPASQQQLDVRFDVAGFRRTPGGELKSAVRSP
jgi:general secretion pathway protein M